MDVPTLSRSWLRPLLPIVAWSLAACGGGSSESVAPPTTPTDQDRIAAATATAQNNAMCKTVLGPFYWEIGDASGARASGSVGTSPPTASTSMPVYSASKWLYAAYVAEKHAGLRAEDVPFLNFTSGYSQYGNFPGCTTGDLVQNCRPGDDTFDSASQGRFYYDSGHMQHHAIVMMGLGMADNAALGAELEATLGIAGLRFDVPQPAAGVVATPAMYTQFLRKVLQGDLRIGSGLGTNKVCANERAPNCNAIASPADASTEAWNYSMGHWVEDDPVVGDGTFSSPGGGGFYPWIDKSRTLYGVLAREQPFQSDSGYRSAQCGRLIRQAWRTGLQVTDTVPTPP